MVGGTMMAVDRRTTGTQLDDQTIDVRASSAITAAIGDRGHVNANSYNRVVLLTGEVPTEADRAKVEAAVAKVENVRAVVNELAVMPNTTLSQQSNDTLITGKVKAAFVDAKELQVASIKVVTERGVVYLMGRVTEAEANVAAQRDALGQRRAEGGEGVRDHHAGRAGGDAGAAADAAPAPASAPAQVAASRRAQPRSRLIRLELSSRPPPIRCTSA